MAHHFLPFVCRLALLGVIGLTACQTAETGSNADLDIADGFAPPPPRAARVPSPSSPSAGSATGRPEIDSANPSAVGDVATESAGTGLDLPPYAGIRHGLGVRPVQAEDIDDLPAGFADQLTDRFRSVLTESGRFVVVPAAQLSALHPPADAAPHVMPARHLIEVRLQGLVGHRPTTAAADITPDIPVRLLLQVDLIDALEDQIVASVTLTGRAGRTPARPRAEGTPDAAPFSPSAIDPGRRLDQASQDAADQAVRFLVGQMQSKPFTAWTTSPPPSISPEGPAPDRLTPGQTFINRGSLHHYRPGLRLTLIQEGQPLVDPATGQSLGRSAPRPVGQLQILSVTPHAAVCQLVDTPAPFNPPPPGTRAEVAP